MIFDEIVKGVGEKLGVELEPQDGVVQLMLDDMGVTIMELPELDSIVLSGSIGTPPPQGLEKLYESLLDANDNFAGTMGATLARDPEDGTIKLTRCIQMITLDVDGFLEIMEKFANVMETWKQILENYRPDESSSSSSSSTNESIPEFQDSSFGPFMQV